MPIEESLGRIATALETIAAAGAAPVVNNEAPAKRRSRSRKPAAPEAPAETPEPPSSEAPAVSRDQVREALRIFRKTNTKDEARAVLAEFEVKSITAASDEVLPALLKAFSV